MTYLTSFLTGSVAFLKSREELKEVCYMKLDPDEELWSYDVSTLFRSVQIHKVLEVIMNWRRTAPWVREHHWNLMTSSNYWFFA